MSIYFVALASCGKSYMNEENRFSSPAPIPNQRQTDPNFCKKKKKKAAGLHRTKSHKSIKVCFACIHMEGLLTLLSFFTNAYWHTSFFQQTRNLDCSYLYLFIASTAKIYTSKWTLEQFNYYKLVFLRTLQWPSVLTAASDIDNILL